MEKNRKIAFFLPNLRMGGAEWVTVQLSKALSELGFNVDLVLCQPDGDLLSDVATQVNIICLNASKEYSVIRKLIRYLQGTEPDILVSALEVSNLMAVLAKKVSKASTKVVIRQVTTASTHERSSKRKKQLLHFFISQLYPKADRIVSISHSVADDLIAYAGLKPQSVQVIYNPAIPPTLSALAEERIDHPWFRPDQPPVILSAGRLHAVKDYATLIKAFALLRQETGARLVILGEGEERRALEQQVQIMGLVDDVDLPGYTPNPYAFMHKSAVFVLSSIREGLSNALIQAMACGCPVVTTDSGGPSEVIKQGMFGSIVPVGDAPAMSQAILKVLRGEGRAADPEWLTQFELQHVVNQYIELFYALSSPTE